MKYVAVVCDVCGSGTSPPCAVSVRVKLEKLPLDPREPSVPAEGIIDMCQTCFGKITYSVNRSVVK